MNKEDVMCRWHSITIKGGLEHGFPGYVKDNNIILSLCRQRFVGPPLATTTGNGGGYGSTAEKGSQENKLCKKNPAGN